ncbi:glycine, glutamate and proline-rich protein-like [Saccostrea echinata]|uniref:glycine, glutamate and proline-rich protein-like n=1 Tax=Saccostrea echinata TaxID=191078 RepID=UPI002A80ED34|nr:glycine, glutamate and proline-rich protein-like [Saccostrea echinata]
MKTFILLATCILVALNGVVNATGNYTCYGNFMSLTPTGAKRGGVSTSQYDVSYLYDSRADVYKSCFEFVGRDLCIHPAVIAGMASRETNVGYDIRNTNGWGDHGNGYGILQCDIRHCPVCNYNLTCTSYPYNSCQHINMMIKYVLIPNINSMKTKFPEWTPEQQLQGAIAAYNTGPGRVSSWNTVDQHTTHGDYSNDVIARAQHLVNNFNW